MAEQSIDVLVDGGAASAGPPLGPALGPLGVNTGEVVKAIKEKTSEFEGMKVPVKVTVDADSKTFTVSVGSPPTSALIKKELGIEKGTGDSTPVGDLSFDRLAAVAKMKKDSLLANDLKAAVKEVLGVCRSMGVNVEGRHPSDLTKEVDEGVFDDKLKD